MKRIGFRARLFLILLLFAVLPSVLLTLVWAGAISKGLPRLSASAAWDSVAASGARAIEAAREHSLTAPQATVVAEHEQELATSVTQARRLQFIGAEATRVVVPLLVVSLVIVLGILASYLAGHLSRQLSRPLAELVAWTERIARGEPLPAGPPRRGAPEFEMLRRRMRKMAVEIEQGRSRALEAERLAAFRETARQVAHELKNPLTPIRFAVERLRREASPELAETVEVLSVESRRLEEMARSFALFGRLPEGPASDIDLAELVSYTAKATVPETMPLTVSLADGVPMVHGHYDALARALSNVLLNAVDACRDGGRVSVRVGPARGNGRGAVEIVVHDTGCGIAPDQLERIWEPYVTNRPGGTGLGLAIARQTVLAHAGSVEATSEPGHGTEIRFVLPAMTTPETRS
ncbi:MAG TPA: HAMP domain-containing sensor histidine kinase [Gemmatimonadaceae bacterium]|nr:HAMP domain-containing sensor histidine kinase [Gemmatimonadaceae bacterium]